MVHKKHQQQLVEEVPMQNGQQVFEVIENFLYLVFDVF
jgi:hypothetical protein